MPAVSYELDFAISLVYREANRSRQQLFPHSLIARLQVVLVEISSSVRVHPTPFSPTPNRHAGIKLEMKGGGPGGSRFELVGLLDPQRKEHARHFGPQKRGRPPSAPPPPGVGIGGGIAVG